MQAIWKTRTTLPSCTNNAERILPNVAIYEPKGLTIVIDVAHKGRVFPPYGFTIERNKLREFLLAIGDDNPIYDSDDPPIPPTFSTVFAFWGGVSLEELLRAVGVEIWNVLHGEQEYEYYVSPHVGDTITGQTRINDIYRKAGMDFIEFMTEYKNQHGEAVLKDHALIIVRG